MTDATVKLGWDNSGARAGAAEALTIAQNLKARTDKALAKVGNPGGGLQKGGMGMIAMQAQDIAVQAQMGTSALQIFAQQGSQVASIFGPGGAIVGGIAAIAGALVFAGQKGNEAFAQIISGSQALNGELGNVIASGSLTQLTDLFGQLEQKQAALTAEQQKLATLGGFAKGILGTFTGGASQEERRAQIAAAMATMEQTRATILRQTLDLADRELAIQLAKLGGNDEQAADLERELELQKRIFNIRNSPAPTDVQNKLIANAIKLAEAEEQAAAAAKRADESRARASARQQLNEAEKAVATFDETDEQKLARLLRERETLQKAVVAARGDEVKQIEAATARAQNELAILQTKKSIAEKTAAEMKKQADEAERLFNAEAASQAAQAQAEAEARKASRTARADAEKQMEILRMRAAGQLDAAAAAEKELAIRQEARRIAEAQNISFKAALQQAREKMQLDEKAGKAGRPEGRIQGFSFAQGGREEAAARAAQRMDEARQRIARSREIGFGGLKELERLNQRDGNGNRAIPLGRVFERSQGKDDAAVGVLVEIKGVMDQVRAHTERLAVE